MLPAARHDYIRLYESFPDPPLYAAPWWLDAACGAQGWDCAWISSGAGSKGCIPFHTTSIRGLSSVINPPLTQWLPVLRFSEKEEIALQDFFQQLPAWSVLDVSFKPDPYLVVPAVSSFPVHFKYSFMLPAGTHADQFRKGYNEGLRRNLREAEKNYSIHSDSDMDSFLRLCQSTFRQRGMKSPPWLHAVMPVIYKSLSVHGCGNMEFAHKDGNIVAAILTAWDNRCAYYLAGGRTNDESGASAHALLLDNAIGRTLAAGKEFDFEGSMHPGIANFFQSFGATPEAYWQVRKFRGAGKLWSLFH